MMRSLDKQSEKIKQDFYRDVMKIARHSVVRQMKKYPHHGNTSCYKHCFRVAYFSYFLCVLAGLRAEEALRAGMLHDLFLYDWHTHAEETGIRFHGLKHPRLALKNAENYFEISDLERDIIVKHMWPLTIIPPRYPEAYIVCLVDKYCCICETLGRFKRK